MNNRIRNKLIRLSVAVVALIFASCAKDPSPVIDDGRRAQEGNGLLALGLTLDHTPISRIGQEGPETEFGTPEENYVGAVRLVLYGYDDHVVKYAFNFKIRTRLDTDTGIPVSEAGRQDWVGFVEEGVGEDEEPHLYASDSRTHFITYAREIELNDYLMLLLINPTQNASDPSRDLYAITAEGKTLDDFDEVVSYAPTSTAGTFDQIRDAAQGGVAADYKFLMNNHRGLIHVPASRLYSSVKASNENPIRVPVSRAVAKVLVEDNVPTAPYANVSDFKWELDVTNKKTYWTRQLTNLLTASGAKGLMEEYGPVPEINEYETSPSYQFYYLTRVFLYARDPNFSGLSNTGAPDPLDGDTGDARKQKLNAMRWEEFNQLEYPGIDSWDETVVPLPVLGKDLGAYTYCLENTMDVTDQYDGVATRVLVSCNYWPAGYDQEEGYFVYNGYYLNPSDMRTYASGGGAGIPGVISNLYADIQALLVGGIDLTLPQAESFESNNIRYYHGGLNYYSVNIQHNSVAYNGYGYYGVLRNNVYKITLSNIKGPGSPTVVNPDPVNMAAKINILQWWDRTQITDL